MNKVTKTSKKVVRKIIQLVMMFAFVLFNSTVSYAGANIAENAAKWGLDQLFWIIIIVSVFVCVTAFIKRSYSSIVATIVVGGILAFFCKNPTTITTLGESISNIIFR